MNHQLNLVVSSLNAGIRELVFRCSDDALEVGLDFLAQFTKFKYLETQSPKHPFLKNLTDFVYTSLDGKTKILFQQVSAIDYGVGLSEKGKLRLLI